MTDLATLGFKVDTSGLAAGATALDSFGAKAKAAGAFVAAGADAAKVANTATGVYAKTVNDAANAHGGYSTQAMAAFHATRSMAEGLAMGIPPAQMLAMQMAHLSYAASGPGGLVGAFKDVGNMVLGVLTPMRVLGGVAAAGAAGMYLLYQSVKTTELQFADLSDRIGSTLQQLHGLQSNATLSAGIGQSDFLKEMEKFGDLSVEAQHGIGNLALLFRANGVAISQDVNVNLAKTAELVAHAANQQEKYRIIQEAGLPATYQWVRYLSQGGDAILAASHQANGFGDSAEQEMIRKARDFDTAWERAWQHFKDEAKTSIIDVGGWLDTIIQKGREGLIAFDKMTGGSGRTVPLNILNNALHGLEPGSRLSGQDANSFYNSFGGSFAGSANGGATTVNPQDVQRSLEMEQRRIQMLGELATVEEKVRLKEIEIQQARLSGISVTQAAETALLNYARAQEEALRAQATVSALGSAATVTEQYDAKLKQLQATLASGAITQDTFNRAVAGLKNDQYIQGLQDTISALGDVAPLTLQYELRIAELKQMLDQGRISQETFNKAVEAADPAFRSLRDATQGFGQDLVSGLLSGKSAMESLTNAAQKYISTLANASLNRVMNGGSFFGNQSLMSMNGAVGIGAAGLAGYKSGNAFTGALGGAMAGATFGPIGAVVGGAAGLIGGLFGAEDQKKKAEEAHRQEVEAAKAAWENMRGDWQKFLGDMSGHNIGGLQQAIDAINQQARAFDKAAAQAGDVHGDTVTADMAATRAASLQGVIRATEQFKESWNDVVASFRSGLGPDSPFAQAAGNIRNIAASVEGFVSDTALVYNSSGVQDAREAGKAYLLTLLQTAPALSDTEKALQTLHGNASALQQALVDLGMSADDAAAAIGSGVKTAMDKLTADFIDGVQSQINDAVGKGYLNDIGALVKDTATKRADALSLGADPALIDRYLTVSAQKIVDSSQLVGDAFSELITAFPELQGKVHQFTQDAVSAAADMAQAQQRLVQTYQGQLADASSALQRAYDQESSALQNTIDKTKQFIQSLTEFRNGLFINNDLSPLSPSGRLAAARQQFFATESAAAGGDAAAQGNLQNIASAYLNEARSYFASSSDYARIFDEVQSALSDVAGKSQSQVDAAQQQLDLLTQQVGTLIDINANVISVAMAVDNVTKAIDELNGANQAAAINAGNQMHLPTSGGTGSDQSLDLFGTGILDRVQIYGGKVEVARGSNDGAGFGPWQELLSGATSSDQFVDLNGDGKSDLLQTYNGQQYIAINNGSGFDAWRPRIGSGYATGGIVGNGAFNADSVMAQYAGGGNIMLAGGEGIINASATRMIGPSVIDLINRTGQLPHASNDNRAELIELIKQTMRGHQALATRLESVESAIDDGFSRLSGSMKRTAERKPPAGGKHAA